MTVRISPSVSASGTRILPFEAAHVPGALALSHAAGWPHRAEDWALSLSVSQGVVALIGDRVVGTALCTRFGKVATVNMIIVAEDCRGRGLGHRLMQRVLDLGEGLELRLVATSDGLPLYRKLGFEPVGEILQHQGIAIPAAQTGDVRRGTPADMPAALAADRGALGMERESLLNRIAGTGTLFLAPGGFALLRAFGRGQVVGPVVARDAGTARALIAGAARQCAGQFLRIDLPRDAGLEDFVTTLGLQAVGGGIAMVRGAGPRTVSDFKTYALASQAFG